jgi:hypothetical protein
LWFIINGTTDNHPMAYYIDLFSPETYQAFTNSSRSISGFRARHENLAKRIHPGDMLVCYVTQLSRWIGLLEVEQGPFRDSAPIFTLENDPFIVRFKVDAQVWLDLDKAIPIHDDLVWKNLSFTRELPHNSIAWTGKVRGSLVRLEDADGHFLAETLRSQLSAQTIYPIDDQDRRRITTHTVVRSDKVVSVSVPDNTSLAEEPISEPEVESRESIRIQALIAHIGHRMGMTIWIPRSDRERVLREWKDEDARILERLPLNYDDTTLRTIEQIDILWLRNRSIVRAFEVEHTTSIYSGILRMADLLALQPNMDINLHIVAPLAKKEKVFQEIRRPVFSLLDRGPLAESCTYLSYDALREIAQLRHLEHISDHVLDEYSEPAE